MLAFVLWWVTGLLGLNVTLRMLSVEQKIQECEGSVGVANQIGQPTISFEFRALHSRCLMNRLPLLTEYDSRMYVHVHK